MAKERVRSVRFDNATVWRGRDAVPLQGSLTVEGGVVAGLGVAAFGADLTRIDLAGAHVVPGFVDAHSHLSVGAWIPWFADAADWKSAARAVEEVRKAAGTRADGWILAFNVDEDDWPDGAPSAGDLEEAAPGRSVMLVHLSLHRAILSETALRRLEITRSMPDPMGDVEKTRGGVPTGRVWEGVFGRALTTALLETARGIDNARLDDLLYVEAERHLAAGITACHDPCIPDELLPAMSRLASRTPLRLSWSRVSALGILDAADVDAVSGPAGDGPASAKLFLDGAHRCALCLDPGLVMSMAATAVARLVGRGDPRPLRELMRYRTIYKRPHFHMPYLRLDEQDLVARIGACRDRGVRVRIHALGNDAVAQACRALRRAGTQDASIEHLVVLSDRELAAVSESGVVVSLQPGFLPHYGPSLLDRGIGRRMMLVPVASLLRAGVPVALSSDSPCGPLDPLFNIRQAVERRLPDGRLFGEAEAISASEAVAAYSVGGRHCIHGKPGAGLEVGAPADFAVLSGAPGSQDARVLRTWIAGVEAWRAPGESAIAGAV